MRCPCAAEQCFDAYGSFALLWVVEQVANTSTDESSCSCQSRMTIFVRLSAELRVVEIQHNLAFQGLGLKPYADFMSTPLNATSSLLPILTPSKTGE